MGGREGGREQASIIIYLKGGETPYEKNRLFLQVLRVPNICKAKKLLLIVLDKEHVWDTHSFSRDPSPLLSALVDIGVTVMINTPGPSSSSIEQWGDLGRRL